MTKNLNFQISKLTKIVLGFWIFRILGNKSSYVKKSKKSKELIAIKAGPGRFQQLRKDLRMKPLFQTSVRLMYLILNASVTLTLGLQLYRLRQQANSGGLVGEK